MNRFPELLRRLFRYYGFEGEAVGDEGALLLRKGSLHIEVVPFPGPGETGAAGLRSVLSRKTGADRRILASLGTFSAEARRLAEEARVQLWDRSRLEEEAGRMLLAEVDTRPAAAADESLLEPFLQGADKALGGRTSSSDETAAPDGPLPALEVIDGEGMLPPSIDQEKARALVSEKLEGAFRLDLRMVPKYCFAYACVLQRGSARAEVRRGILLVDGVGGVVSGWEPSPLSRWDGAAARMEPALEQGQALEKAREWVASENTRVVHLKHERGSVTVYEKVTLKPSADAINLEYRGLVLWPVWGIEGGNGAVVLDGVDGRILKEELFAPAARPDPASRANGHGR